MSVLLDAAIGTGLRNDGQPTDALCFSDPARVSALHGAHLAAGAVITTTNSFLIGAQPSAANRRALAEAAVRCAREAGAERVWGAVSPVGAVVDGARALRDAGVERVLLETFTDLGALVCALESLRDVPTAATFTFLAHADVRPEEVADRLLEAGAGVIGANCGDAERTVDAALAMAAHAPDAPVVATPAGGPRFLTAMRRAYDVGLAYLGGCCGTGVAELRALASWSASG